MIVVNISTVIGGVRSVQIPRWDGRALVALFRRENRSELLEGARITAILSDTEGQIVVKFPDGRVRAYSVKRC